MHVVIGTGGLAKQALSMLEKTRILYFDNTTTAPNVFNEAPVVNTLEELQVYVRTQPFKFTVCIGNPHWRKHFHEILTSMGGISRNLISEKSVISEHSVNLDSDNMFLDFVTIEPFVTIGKGNLFNCYSAAFHDSTIGNFNEVMPGALILGGAKIGDNCRIGSNSTILPKVSICNNVVIGAGAVVVKDISSPGTYVGVPATLIKEK